jgi:hypothetical protein
MTFEDPAVRRHAVLRKLDLVRHQLELRGDDRIQQVVVAHLGDGIDLVECWVVFDEAIDLRTLEIAGCLHVIPEHGLLVADLTYTDNNLPSDEALRAIFRRPVKHLWIGIDE